MLRAVFSWVYVEFFFDLVLGDGLGVLSGIYAFRGVWFYGFGVWGCVFLNSQARATLINEEMLLFAKYLRGEAKVWDPRMATYFKEHVMSCGFARTKYLLSKVFQ